jgi:class 3 adenylate cyclase/MFS family permease
MRRRGAVWLAWGICGIPLVLAALNWLLYTKNAALGNLPGDSSEVGSPLFDAGVLLVFSIPAALIVSRQPRNPIGWLLAAIGYGVGLGDFAGEYAYYAILTAPGALPAAVPVLWLGNSLGFWLGVVSVPLLLLLFPNGRLPSRAWRPVAWATLATPTLAFAANALYPRNLAADPRLPENPTGIHGWGTTLATVTNLSALLFLVFLFVSLTAVGVRFRRAAGIERQQLKWFAYGASVLVLTLIGLVPLLWGGHFGFILLGFGVFAGCVAVAMLRYRLYDIDQLITRTVVYGLLTALATMVYLAIVVGIGTLVGSRGEPNLFLTIVATAVIAVAFQPARDRSRRLANRLVYGKRASPYEVLSGFSRGMASASTDDSLLRMACLVVEATGAVQATVWLRLGEVLQPQAAWPETEPSPQPIALEGRSVQEALAEIQPSSRSFPVGSEEELLGALTVTTSPREPLTLAGEKLIADLATQTGLGLRFQRMKERALFARALASFLPPEVAELVEASPSALSLREELEATILFSDIRGFSSLAERLPPRQVAEVVGRHLAAMVEVVTSHGGVLDKFAGDAVMAVFGAPRPAQDHARRALACAAAMQRRQMSLNEEAAHGGLPRFQIGIGVNTGTVVAGTLGGAGRLDYTVLGDAVNVAQRLQSEAVGGEILASAVTVQQSGTDRAEPAGFKHLKGRQELVEVYRIRWVGTSTATAEPSEETAHAE